MIGRHSWVRAGDKDHDGCAVVVCNGDEGYAYILVFTPSVANKSAITCRSKFLYAGKEHAGEKWTDVLGWHTGEVTIGESGWAEFRCPARSVSIWTKTDARGRDEFKKD